MIKRRFNKALLKFQIKGIFMNVLECHSLLDVISHSLAQPDLQKFRLPYIEYFLVSKSTLIWSYTSKKYNILLFIWENGTLYLLYDLHEFSDFPASNIFLLIKLKEPLYLWLFFRTKIYTSTAFCSHQHRTISVRGNIKMIPRILIFG